MKLTLSLLMLLSLAPLLAQDTKAKKEMTNSTDNHGRYEAIFQHVIAAKPGGRLEIKDMRGDVVIHGTDGKKIKIVEKIRLDRDRRNSGDDFESIEDYARDLSGWLELIPDEIPVYTFRVERGRHRNTSFYYKISVPKVFNVFVKSYGGDIDLAELKGELNIKTGGGDISVANTSGRVLIKTSGGDIDVFKIEGQIDMYTSGGDIEGRKVEGKVFAKTGGGDIEMISSKGALSTETGGGDIELRRFKGTSIKARTGGGDFGLSEVEATVNLMTGGGDIEIERMIGDVEVASGGGDISLDHATGDMILYTNHGDIEVDQIQGALQLRSGGGDVDISEWRLEGAKRAESVIESRDGDVSIEFIDDRAVNINLKVLGSSPRYGSKQIHGNVDFDISRKEGDTIGWYGKKNPSHTINVETRDGSITINRTKD